jgi:hypothetical protein
MSRSRCRYAKNVTCVTSQDVTLSGRYEGDEKPPPQPPPSELFWGRRRSLQAFGRGCISAFAGARNTGQSAASGEVSARLQHAQLVASKYKQAKEKLKIDRPVRGWGRPPIASRIIGAPLRFALATRLVECEPRGGRQSRLKGRRATGQVPGRDRHGRCRNCKITKTY